MKEAGNGPEVLVEEVLSSFTAQLKLFQTAARICTPAAPALRSQRAVESAVSKLSSAFDLFGQELQDAWGVPPLKRRGATFDSATLLPPAPAAGHNRQVTNGSDAHSEDCATRQPSQMSSFVEEGVIDTILDVDHFLPPRIAKRWCKLVHNLVQKTEVSDIMWPTWQGALQKKMDSRSLPRISMRSNAARAFYKDVRDEDDPARGASSVSGKLHTWEVSSPTAPWRIIWDLLTCAVLVYDLFTLPLSAFEYESLGFYEPLRYSVAVFWTFDLPATFCVGYEERGTYERRFFKVVHHYIKTWLLLDCIVVFSEWVMIAFDAPGGAASVGRIGKSIRVIRVIRLFRAVRIAKLAAVTEKVGVLLRGGLQASFETFMWLFCLVLICHVVGCLWYWVGTTGERNWVDQIEQRIGDVPLAQVYAISFHWTIAQFTPSSSPFNPANLQEEVFNLFFIVVGLTLFSSFIGNVTATMTSLRKGAVEHSKHAAAFREFAHHNHLTWELRLSILKYVKHRHTTKGQILEKDVPFMSYIPETLLIRTRCQVVGPTLCGHPLFRIIQRESPIALMFTCHAAAMQVACGKTDELFTFHTVASRMLILMQGHLVYFRGAALDEKSKNTEFWPGARLTEASLWMSFIHEGRLMSDQSGTLIVAVDSAKFRSVVSQHPKALALATSYAVAYVQIALSTPHNLDTLAPEDPELLCKQALPGAEEVNL